ncbi:MAG: HD domain-containing protein, partial [Candidatus Bathyarchaeota archaeon]
RSLVGRLPRPLTHLLNAVLWDGLRFHRYVVGPSSIAGHHADSNGNLRHSVEVAETSLSLAVADAAACRSVLVLAALLHDAGKAEEYEYDHARRCFTMSTRGILVGHKHTLLEWIAAARAEHRVAVPEDHYLGLLHCLTAAKGPDYLGLRPPVTREATILSAADRLSGHADLIAQTAPQSAGFGRYHKHLGGRAFVVADADNDPMRSLEALPRPAPASPLHGP